MQEMPPQEVHIYDKKKKNDSNNGKDAEHWIW